MKILAFDTSTMTTTTALVENDKVLASYSLQGQAAHSEAMLDLIQDFLNHLGIALQEIDLIAVGVGPGSFTGLRIATTAAKVLAQILDKPVIGISSLETLAESVAVTGLIVPIINANRGRVYTAPFIREETGELRRLGKDDLLDLEEVLEIHQGEDPIFISPQREKFEEEILNSGFNWYLGDHEMSAVSLARVAKRYFISGSEDNLYELVPNYMREAQVIRKKKKRKHL